MHNLIGGGDGRNHNGGDQFINCPRCDSTNTKFCYFNNYNLTQPRHFCKTCRRYWTNGGILRNVPVGGGCRKPKRSSSKTKIADASSPVDRNSDNVEASSNAVHPTAPATAISSESRSGDPSAASEFVCPDGWNLKEETDGILDLSRKEDWLWPSHGMNMPEIMATDRTAQMDLTGTVDEAYWSQIQWTYSDTSHQSFYLP